MNEAINGITPAYRFKVNTATITPIQKERQ
jgi:hypothetical protein